MFFDQSAATQDLQRVAHRLARDAEPQRDFFLSETLPGRQRSVRDRVHEALVHLIDERAGRGDRFEGHIGILNSEFQIVKCFAPEIREGRAYCVDLVRFFDGAAVDREPVH